MKAGDKFQAVGRPSPQGFGAIIKGFTSEAEARFWLREYLRLLDPPEPTVHEGAAL